MLISYGGDDKSHGHIIAKDIVSYLEDHYQKLLANYYFNGRGKIEAFSQQPHLVNGSVTITNGIKIEAVGLYIHHFSIFDDKYFQEG